MNIFRKISQRFNSRKTKARGVFSRLTRSPHLNVLTLLFVLGLFMPETAFAGDAGDDTLEAVATMLSLMMNLLNALLWPILLVIGDLMSSDFITGPGMEGRIRSIWVQVRNLVNIAFVLVLLAIAFYNILGIGGGEGNFALKTALPRLILGIILVNFTFAGGRLIIDMASIGTTAVFALPEMVDNYNFENDKEVFENEICLKKVSEDGGVTYWQEKEDGLPISVSFLCALEAGEGEANGQYTGKLDAFMEASYFTDLNANNIGMVMAVNMGAINQQVLIKPDAIDTVKELIENGLFSLIMFVVFAITYLVLGIVLLVRIIVLWIAMALSPVAVLFYVVPQLKDLGGGGGDLQNKVVKTLLAPIIIGLSLTIGYLMLNGWNNLAGGSFLSSGAGVDDILSKEFLISGTEDLSHFIIALASVAVVWTGVFAAAQDTWAGTITDKIKGFTENIAGKLAQAPLYATTIPVATPSGETANISIPTALAAVPAALEGFTRGKKQEQLTSLGKAFPKFGKYINGADVNTPGENYNDIRRLIGKDGTDVANGKTSLTESEFKQFQKKLAAIVRKSDDLPASVSSDIEAATKFSDLQTALQGKYDKLNIAADEQRQLKAYFEQTGHIVTPDPAAPAAATAIDPAAVTTIAGSVEGIQSPVASLVTTITGTDKTFINHTDTANPAVTNSQVKTQLGELTSLMTDARSKFDTAKNAGDSVTDSQVDAAASAAEATLAKLNELEASLGTAVPQGTVTAPTITAWRDEITKTDGLRQKMDELAKSARALAPPT